MDIQPDPEAMLALLDHLFGDAPEGKVELAWTDAKDGKLRHANLYGLDRFDDLIEQAVKENQVPGQNV